MLTSLIRCPNCGTTWSPRANGSLATPTTCDVCELGIAPSTAPLPTITSINELAQQLDQLVREARAHGLDAAAIVQVLSDELAFAAEIGHAGQRFAVQLIDLGPQSGERFQREVGGQSERLIERRGRL